LQNPFELWVESARAINDNGDFCLKGKGKPVNLEDKIQTFVEYAFCVMKVFSEEKARITKKKQD